MKVKLLLESATISAVFVVLMSTTVFAGYPGPDYDTDTDFGDYGSWAVSAVAGHYYGPSYYGYEEYYSVRDPGSAQNDGDMYFVWFAGEDFYQDWYSGNYVYGWSSTLCTLVASYTVADFKYGQEEWTCEALAVRQIY